MIQEKEGIIAVSFNRQEGLVPRAQVEALLLVNNIDCAFKVPREKVNRNRQR